MIKKKTKQDKIIIQVLGPTGVGKSKTAVRLARLIDGEIISADSMQVYKDFNIGTDKIKPVQMEGVPHHLIDIFDNCAQFNASIFLSESFKVAEEIIRRDRIPIVCGGTALYLRCMTQGIFPESERKRISRRKLDDISGRKGLEYMWKRLHAVDPHYAQKIGPNDKIRILRGLEIYYNNGIPPSDIFKSTRTPFEDYRFIRLGLKLERQELYRRIESRVDNMIKMGLLEEVRELRRKYPESCPPFKSLGYKEMIMFLNGEICFEKAVELIKQYHRNFAKRQLSWFRREDDIRWFEPGQFELIRDYIREQL